MDIYTHIDRLVSYALKQHLIEPEDKIWAVNQLLPLLGLNKYISSGKKQPTPKTAAEALAPLCDWAAKQGLISPDTVTQRDLFDTRIMGIFTPRPSEVQAEFSLLYKARSPQAATDKLYHDAQALNYIRTDRIAKNRVWKTDTPYGTMDITINLSKPEKDPRDIAAWRNNPYTEDAKYPACLLCKENEGFAGTHTHPARQNLRLIPLNLGADGQIWFLQYSPYVYYNEHCIVFSGKHEPMKITRRTFERLLNFVDIFPHYFIGSNADLPIVGGSILTHDHFQGGHYLFPMEKAPVQRRFSIKKFPKVKASIVHWPLSVIRLQGSKNDVLQAAVHIFKKWQGYSDPQANIAAFSGKTPHNTLTPIARRRGKLFEMDLALRNNRTDDSHPDGIFHPHTEVHHIKHENIGLIEVMGLAVLPARLVPEMETLIPLLLKKNLTAIHKNPAVAKHEAWAKELLAKYKLTAKNVRSILRKEIGLTFAQGLEHCGVFKQTPQGREAWTRFISKL